MDDRAVPTANGSVRGQRNDGTFAFRGIPYGADTGGTRRFRPPTPPRRWTGVRDCYEYAPSCPQISLEAMLGIAVPPESEALMGTLTAERATSEDCLALNVWTPTLDPSAALPVLVWLHGGGWSTGSASWPLYDFTNAARRGDAVYIGVNHRVGILGFLHLAELGEELADSGNAGMLDIVAALEWVRDNIAAFGGNPRNVTVFGESGGGAKTSTLLTMPAADGLFHQAAVMSGTLLAAQEPERAARNTYDVFAHLGIDAEVAAIEHIDVSRLIDAEVELPERQRGPLAPGRGFGPVLGPSLPEHPEAALGAGSSRSVTLVTGCTTDEAVGFLVGDADLWSISFADVARRLEGLLGDRASEAVETYRDLEPDASPAALLIDITSDALWRVPHVRIAEAKLAGGGPAPYVYEFGWGFTDPDGRIRSFHGADMPYFFDNVEKALIAQGPHAAGLVAAANGVLAALARSGDPNHHELPAWPAYSTQERATMHLDVISEVVHDPRSSQRYTWNDHHLVGLGPRAWASETPTPQ